MNKARTQITVRTDEVLIIRTTRVGSRTPCPECTGATLLVTTEEAIALTSVSSREIYRWVEKGWVHFAESPAGALLVCPDSILKLPLKSAEHSKEGFHEEV